MPKPGDAITEAIVSEILVPDGDQVEEGAALYCIETDKVENDVEAPVAGVVHITGEEGEIYEVGVQIGEIE